LRLEEGQVDRAAVTPGGEHSIDAIWTANTGASVSWRKATAQPASALQALAAGIRTSLQTGDTSAARTAVDNLSTKVHSFAAKLNTDTGVQLKAAIAALKAALPAS
jgi:hypothetical protein